jgi:cobalt-zinc-cadmium efflux system outer membrane protein
MTRLCRLAFLVATAVAVGRTVGPVSAGERDMPGATVESVVALARRLSPELAASGLDADAAQPWN